MGRLDACLTGWKTGEYDPPRRTPPHPRMLLTVLTFALAAAEPVPAAKMPAPPAGHEAAASLAAPAGADEEQDTPDDPEVSKQVEQESEELEELRALEDVTVAPQPDPDADLLRAVRRMGLANPLRQRLLDALGDVELREDAAAAELPRITDLSSFDPSVIKDEYDIPIEMQPLVAEYIRFFQGPGRKWFRAWMNRSTRFIPLMQPILTAQGLPKDTVYLAMIESGFSPHAYSWARAAGPWQFIAGTARLYGLRNDFWVDERRDPVKSTRAAARYLQQLHSDLGHWYLAWAAYNAGGGKVRRMIDRKGSNDFWVLSDGKGFAQETKHYVPKLIACALVAKHPKAFGFGDEEFDFLKPLEWDEVPLTSPTDLQVIARSAGVPVEEIIDLNPELKRWCTPPASERAPYLLRLPKGTQEHFAENLAKIAPQERLTFQVHKVKKGDTLSAIAAAYHSAPEAIMQFNRMRNARSLRLNTELVIPVPDRRAPTPHAEAALDRQVAQARRSGFVAHRPEEEIPAGTPAAPVATGPIATETIGGKTRITYGVQSGDSLWAISQRFNCSVEDLRRWNNLSPRARRLSVGTRLHVWPGEAPIQVKQGTVVAEKGKKTVHQLAAGETLWSVAQRYNVSIEDIKRWNGITNYRSIQAGTQITLMLP